MKKKFLLSLVLLLALSNLSAQDKTLDSLKLALKNAKHDTTRCNILNLLIETAPYGEWEKYNEELKSTSEINLKKIIQNNSLSKFFKKHLAYAFDNIGEIYYYEGDMIKAQEYFIKGLRIYEEVGDKRGVSGLLGNIGVIYEFQGNTRMALDYYEKSLKIESEIGDKQGMGYSLNNIGGIYRDQGNIYKAIDYYYMGLKNFEETQDKNGIATSLNNIGLLYRQQGDLKKGLENYKKSL